ncbi:hypothetical protein QT381_05345 [Galbitalea sp. SE-J8]|uniref:hypothetical protein n=1 Tax=Galbitalea sp. SE-J8 TaxID=3054952 RepID=UPI00259D08C0|nr:hypothetical protein [Galbitalea sp. SE-J8]MDM4762429.1 hypothetical protein [Galbitalea sp. SE-J8]
MSIFDRSANLEGGSATYEWHGEQKKHAASAAASAPDLTVAPTCSTCSNPMIAVVGGFWCETCESGAL